MYGIYYVKNNYMFRHVTMAIFRLRMKKLSKQMYSTYVDSILPLTSYLPTVYSPHKSSIAAY